MKKTVLSLIMLSFIGSVALAQKNEVNSAKNNYALFEVNLQAKADLKKQLEILNLAKASADKAIVHEKTKNSAELWAYRSLIYSSIAVSDTVNTANAESAFKTALESIAKTKELDKENANAKNIENAERNISIMMQNKGIAAFNKKDFNEAYKSFKYIADVMPTDSTFNMYTAIAANSAQLPDEAIKYYKKTLELNTSNSSVYQELGRLYLTKSDTTNALKIFEEGREKHPEYLPLIYDELNIYLNRGEAAKQISKIETAIAKDPTNKTLLFVLGIAHNSSNQFDKAEEAYVKALQIDPSYNDAIYNLSVIYINRGNNYILEANKLPNNKASEAKYEALKSKFEAELGKALPLLEKARELNPKDANVLTTLREVYVKLNKMDKAAEVKRALSEL
jgi:tetratricopeptide (TPR) repeat protein